MEIFVWLQSKIQGRETDASVEVVPKRNPSSVILQCISLIRLCLKGFLLYDLKVRAMDPKLLGSPSCRTQEVPPEPVPGKLSKAKQRKAKQS